MYDWSELKAFVNSNECNWTREPESTLDQWGIHLLDTPPHNKLLGPVFARGGPAGLVSVAGNTLCEWGDIHRPDMTFSVTKTCLALITGIAVDAGLIKNIDDSIHKSLPGIGFDDNHNRQITFRQMLQFTSEWSGNCFGIPDQVDHYRNVSMQPVASTRAKGDARAMRIPGSHWEYNDIRINQFSLALLHLFKKPLPEVFKEHIMDPIGASDTWQWHGYDNSYVEINGKSMQSVPGGGHWGGGLVIAPADQALLGQFMLQQGQWHNKQLLSSNWIKQMLTPCTIAPYYGFFTWLNTGNTISKSASPESYFAMGIGGQLVWHDPVRHAVCVFRWLGEDATQRAIELVTAQLDLQQTT